MKTETNKDTNKLFKAFELQLLPIYRDLYKFIYSLVRNKSMADDVLQSTLLNAYYSYTSLRDDSKFKPWIFTIAKHESFSYFKKFSREVSTDLSESIIREDNEFNIPEQYLINKEFSKILIEAINGLRDTDRDIVILYYFSGLKFEEIAEILNINYNTVRTRHRTIKKILYESLCNNELTSEIAVNKCIEGVK